MEIAILQFNPMVGDLEGNAKRLAGLAREASSRGARIAVTPELALTGYPPEDLVLRQDFLEAGRYWLEWLAQQVPSVALVVGHIDDEADNRFNAASVLDGGRILATYRKKHLPNHSVFDEVRYFVSSDEPCVVNIDGVRIGLAICADVWEADVVKASRKAGAELLLVPNASPYHLDKLDVRYEVVRDRIKETGLSVIYVNLVGGQDELVFDGASFAMDATGNVVCQLPACEEVLELVTYENQSIQRGPIARMPVFLDMVWRVLLLGLKDYVGKNRFNGCLIGLSGGIDSALTLALAVDALGADRVNVVMMPSRYTSDLSLGEANVMAKDLGVDYKEIRIQELFETYLATLEPYFSGLKEDVTEENIQARIRANILMALSNKFGSLVLATGNKSEMAVGYATLYGDMAGGFCVLKDIEKTLVYNLARWRNSQSRVIPQAIIDRPPSAELRANQQDVDSLPPYSVLDPIIRAYVEKDLCPAEIVALGYDDKVVNKVISMIDRSEYKRRQAAVGIRLTERGFGRDRRYPITSGFRP
ncbi:MAG: NAD+ synthase [Pseudomonadota bacterium]|nr:NAD+ synthase [Pseudomonadota bacterium]